MNEDIVPTMLDRKKVASREAYVSTVLNVFLFAIKICLALIISSIALTADAFHTLSDISTSLVILFSFKAATKMPDEEHPFGHGRWEPIATLIIAVMLVVAGIELMLEGIRAVISGSHGEANLLVAGIVLLTAISKELLARYSMKLGREIDSDTLMADAWHHRTDALSSMGVALAIALSDSIPMIDGLAAMFVSVLIIKTGIDFIRKTCSVLLGHAPNKKTVDRICDIVMDLPGVIDVHRILVHDYISIKSISLHIYVDENMSLSAAHEIANSIEKKVGEKLLAEVNVHVEPADR